MLIGTLSGCSSSSDSGSEPIRLAVYPLTSPYFEYAIEELGLFEEYGANVELVEFAQYTDVIQALDSGNVDASIMGITEAVAPICNDIGLEIVYMTDYSAGMDGIVASKDISSLEELSGKTVAVNIGTMNHMLLLSALESVGLTEDDVNIVNMSEGDAAAALVGGSIDAASIFDPQLTNAARESGGSIIFTSEQLKGELSDVLLVNESITSERADEVEGIIRSWIAVQEKYAADPESVISCISDSTDLTEEEFLELMAGLDIASADYNKEMFANGGEKMAELVSRVSDFLYDTECIDSVPSAESITAAIDTAFVDAIE